MLRTATGGLVRAGAEVEDRALAEPRVLLGLLAGTGRHRQCLQHAPSCGAGRVQGAALDQALDRPLVDGAVVYALAELIERGELAAGLASLEDRLHGLV